MTNTLATGVMNILVQAVLSILGVLMTYLVTVVVSYISKKREALIKQMGAEQYNATYCIAKGIFFAVEQQFKSVPAAAKEKRKLFDAMLLSKVPGLTQEEIDHFREAVVGEINNQIKQAQLLQQASSVSQMTAPDTIKIP
jgi:hypothetical protein